LKTGVNRRFQLAVVLAIATGVLPWLRLAGIDRDRGESIGALWYDPSGQDGMPSKAWSGDTRGTDLGCFLHAHAPDVPPEASSPDFGPALARSGHAGSLSASGLLFLQLRRLRI
jgi:hypothetical protein